MRARKLREGQTDAEALLWSKLRSRQLLGLKFRRQRPVGIYFADFACLEIGLIIELDGGQHSEGRSIAYDGKRAADFVEMGFQTLRFWNNEVLNETDAVLEKIRQVAGTLTPALSREREREETGAKRSLQAALTPALSREREKEETGAKRSLQAALTPALSREREKEETGAKRNLEAALTPALSRERERE